ncbi:MAG: hypothetical protein Q4F84_10660, partial [Fibrobacter sp.]|nr:hypothetical protein [Fibrobacter sp.]
DDYGNKKKQTFDHDKFYEWALKQENPVFISEYNMPEDFICIAEREKRNTLSATANIKVIERIFVPKHQYKNVRMFKQLELF